MARVVVVVVDEVNRMLERMRNVIADAEADVADKKEARRIAKERKEAAEAEYERYDRQVTAAQERVTRLKRSMNDLLAETGV